MTFWTRALFHVVLALALVVGVLLGYASNGATGAAVGLFFAIGFSLLILNGMIASLQEGGRFFGPLQFVFLGVFALGYVIVLVVRGDLMPKLFKLF